jgi:hypothetical protein
VDNHQNYDELKGLKGEARKLMDGSIDVGLYNINDLMKKLTFRPFRNDIQ